MGNPRIIIFSQNGFEVLPLDALNVEIFLLAGHVVGTHDTCFLASLNNAGEDTTKSVEATFVGCRYHLRDVHHQWCSGIAALDTQESFVVLWT
jgi:hypothetical protein